MSTELTNVATANAAFVNRFLTTPTTWSFSASGNGSSEAVFSNDPLQLVANGTFGGGTVTLQSSIDGGTTWNTVSGISITSSGAAPQLIYASWGELFRAVLTGGTSPSLTVYLQEVGN